ncbi:hypothetical protein V6617_07790 [Pelagibacterium nitratireducens]|jgi:hypothetical protein|uniref:Transcriptional regulator n=1 Tax=Pelagibacterium nitratireducens TaxID=1046114 RepID=A0ABZ2IB92_9HYPH|tara:strand:+ start:315 stop:446 length:132 start_codon:yes stop_codon:yes gene_type:complete
MNFKLPDHADRRKASNDAKRALLDKLKASRKTGKADTAQKSTK